LEKKEERMKKAIFGILMILALVATPVMAEETYFLYSGTDTINDTTTLYRTIGVWGDGNLTIDYAKQTTHGNPSDTAAVMDQATLTINDGIFEGFVGAPFYYGSFDIDGDSVPETATNATLILNGGAYHYRMGGTDGVLNMSVNGGTFDNQYDAGAGTYMKATNLTINDGTFNTGVAREYRIQADELTVNGGTFNSDVRISSGENLTINGGTFNDALVYFIYGDQNSEAVVTGGDFSNVKKWGAWNDFGKVHISGGDFSNYAVEWTNTYQYNPPEYHLYGSDFTITDLYGAYYYDYGSSGSGVYYGYDVMGTLSDGSTFNQFAFFDNQFTNSRGELVGADSGPPTFIFHDDPYDPGDDNPVPEPTTMALLGLGALGLAGARKRR
jgi:hypothetical protein